MPYRHGLIAAHGGSHSVKAIASLSCKFWSESVCLPQRFTVREPLGPCHARATMPTRNGACRSRERSLVCSSARILDLACQKSGRVKEAVQFLKTNLQDIQREKVLAACGTSYVRRAGKRSKATVSGDRSTHWQLVEWCA
eukprot:3556563-Amphidinium_carterae.2